MKKDSIAANIISDSNSEESKSSSLFDPSKFILSQDFGAAVCVKKLLTTIPVRKPNKQEFVRVHPDAAYQLETRVFEDKNERETYLVKNDLWEVLSGELISKVLITAINRTNDLFLWPIRLPDEDGRQNSWSSSALEAAKFAKTQWVRIQSNMRLGAYDTFQASGTLTEPVWPDIDLTKILETAFKERYIQDLDHPVLRRLRGEI